jgi:CheY-like chemotaxis protein
MRKLRVLVVEDETLVAMLVEDILNDLGHEVGAIASRMPDALEIARGGEFDLAIIDINLDGQPSYPVADILAERGVPFIFATGYGSKGLDPKYSNTPVLTKPFVDAELETALWQISKPI